MKADNELAISVEILFKSVLGNQQAGTQSSGRETVRIGVLFFDLCHVT